MSVDDPTPAELIDIWQEALTDVAALCRTIEDDDWDAQTPCPGWSVGDVVSHLIDIECLLAGRPRPDHEPDWSVLPHATGDFGRFTEIGVDHRRGRDNEALLAELEDVTAERRAQLDAVPEGEPVIGPLGNPTTLDRLLRMRCLDIWMHEQDIRSATGIDGGWDTRPAHVSFQQITRSLPYVWSRTVQAPVGSTLHLVVTGPGVIGDALVTVVEEGKGEVVTDRAVIGDDEGASAVTLTLRWPDLVQLAAGRIPPDDPALRSRLSLGGDPTLGALLLPALSITP